MWGNPQNIYAPPNKLFSHKIFIFWPDEIFDQKYAGFLIKNYIMKSAKMAETLKIY